MLKLCLLESFQLYAAKKIQRFYAKVPNACCLYALGWMRLERFVQVKKMLFIQSILNLDDQVLSRKIFCERATVIFESEGHHLNETSFSLVNDLLNTADIFNLWDEVRNMVLRGHRYAKFAWKTKVWERAWDLEDVYWRLQFNVCRSLDIIGLTPGGSLGYLGGCIRSLSKLKNTPKALISGQKSTLILIKR